MQLIICEELNHGYATFLFFFLHLIKLTVIWWKHTTDGAPFNSCLNTIAIYNVCQDLQVNIQTVENGVSGLHISLQNGKHITENKCCLWSAWQTKEKHMQRNMIMPISCQGLCVRASYVNYTTGCICTASVLWDRFQLMALLKSTSWVCMAYCIHRWESSITLFMDDYYVEKNMFGSKSDFPKMCVICRPQTATCCFFWVHSF